MTAELHPDRAVALAYGLALLLFGGVWLTFSVPFFRGIAAGLRTGNWWRLFEPDERGRHGYLARARQFASFRAPEPARRTRAGLVTRWVIWTYVVAGIGYLPATFVVRLVQLAVT